MKKILKSALFVTLIITLFITMNTSVLATQTELPNSKSNSNEHTIYVKGEIDYTKAYEVLDIVNEERKKQGAGPLKMDESLLESAMQRATEISIFFAHERTDGTECFTVNDKMRGENIAAGSTTSTHVMELWMNSPGHRTNLLSQRWESVGIGCFCVNGMYYWTQCFSPEIATEPVKIPKNYTSKRVAKVIDEYISFEINNKQISLKKGETTTNKIYTINTGWKVVKTELQPESCKWTSSNNKIVTVDNNGLVKAVGVGEATITAKIGNKSVSYKVNISLPFTDVKPTDWYYNSVAYNYLNKLIYGTTNTKFEPNNKLTRGMLVTILWRMDGSKLVGKNQKFPDVKQGQYYYDAIKWAAQNKIVSGYSDGTFKPSKNITREQLATILKNYATYKNKDVVTRVNLNKFTDNKGISDYAKDSVSWAIAKKIMNGKVNGTRIDPRGTATRAETAAMIANYCNYIGR